MPARDSISHCARTGRHRPRGFTLIEMLAVLAIVSLLMALGVGAYRRYSKTSAEEAEFASLDVLIRQARTTALLEGAGAYVLLDANGASARSYAHKLAGTWHFEDRTTTGAFGLDAAVVGNARTVPGRIGNCLDFTGGGYVDTRRSEEFSGEDGMYLEAFVLASHTGCDQTIMAKGEEYVFRLLRGGVLAGKVGGETIEGTRFALSPRTWYKVAFRFDDRCTALLVDGAVVAWGKGVKARLCDAPLTIGSHDSPFYGLVDEVRVFTVLPGQEWKAEGKAKLTHTAGAWSGVHFGPDGGLDVRCHSAPVTVTLVKKNKKRSITVEMTGLVTMRPVEEAPPPPDDEQVPAQQQPQAPAPPAKGAGAKTVPQPLQKKLLSEEAEQ